MKLFFFVLLLLLALASAVFAQSDRNCVGPGCASVSHREWLDAVDADGRRVKLWGWMSGGWVRYWPSEQVPSPSPSSSPGAPPAGGELIDGIQVETLNRTPEGSFLTNDPSFRPVGFASDEVALPTGSGDGGGVGPVAISSWLAAAASLVVLVAVLKKGSRSS